MKCELFLIRHGQTECNANGTHQIYQTPLSELGRKQARRLAERLAGCGAHALYSSDLDRAHQTAEAIHQATGLPIRIDSRLREHDMGIFKGLTPEQARQADPESYARWLRHDCDARCPEGESLRDVTHRIGEALSSIVAEHDGERVLVVTHGRALRCALMHLLNLPDDAFSRLMTPNTGINIIGYDDSGPNLITWGDTHHLDAM